MILLTNQQMKTRHQNANSDKGKAILLIAMNLKGKKNLYIYYLLFYYVCILC